METRRRKALKALAVFLAFSFAQVYVQAGLPNPAPEPGTPQRPVTAKLITKNNQPITVNGNSTGTGATLLTGATIETPDQYGATIDLGDAGELVLQPGAQIQLDFDENGNVRVKVIRGCAVARKKTNVLPGEIEMYTDTASEKTDKKRRNMGFCFCPGGLCAFNPGLSSLAIGTIGGSIFGGSILAVALTRGGNTSPAR